MNELLLLAENLLRAKNAEKKAKDWRIAVEREIEKLIPGEIEGTTNQEIDGYKISVTRKLTRSLDHSSYLTVKDSLPIQPVDYKPSINLKNLRHLEAIDPALTAIFITTKPTKANVKVKEVESGN
jgi:hypothetical protein